MAIRASKKGIDIILKAHDQTRGAFNSVGGSINKLEKAGKSAGTALKYMGAAIVGLAAGAGVAITQFGKFEKRMSDIGTLLGKNMDGLKDLEKGILDMTKVIPVNPDELGAAAYDIVSASIKGTSNQLKVLEESAKLSITGLGTVEESADLVTSAINAFGIEASNVNRVANTIFKTVRHGKNRVSDLAQSFGLAAPIVKDAGVSLEEFSAAVAAFTAAGEPASVAQTQLRALMLELQKPSKEMAELLQHLGYESGRAAIKQEGLLGTLLALKKAAGGSDKVITKLYGRIEGLTAAKILTGEGMEKYKEAYADMIDPIDELTEKYKTQLATLTSLWQLIKNNFQVALIETGRIIAEVFAPEIDYVRDLIERWSTDTDLQEKIQEKLREAVKFTKEILKEYGKIIWDTVESTAKWLYENRKLIGAVIKLGIKLSPILIALWGLAKVISFVRSVWSVFVVAIAAGKAVIPVIMAIKTAITAMSVATGASMLGTLGTIGILAAGVVSWGIVIHKAITDWQGFKDIWKRYWEGLKHGITMIGLEIQLVIVKLYVWVRQKLLGMVKWVAGIASKIASAVTTVFNAIKKVLGVQNKVKDPNAGHPGRNPVRPRSTRRSSPAPGSIRAPSWRPRRGIGQSILGLAEGGIVTRPTFAMVGESGPEAVVPLNKSGGFGGVTINIQGNYVGSEEEAERLGNIIMSRAKLNRKYSY